MIYEIDDNKQFYMNYNPDLNVSDSTMVDIDNNGINDVSLKINQYGPTLPEYRKHWVMLQKEMKAISLNEENV